MIIPWDNEEIPFLRHFGTNTGRWLSNRLYLKGKNSEKLANKVSYFFWNFQAAITIDKSTTWKTVNPNYCYHKACLIMYKDMISYDNYDNLPNWVKKDIDTAFTYLNKLCGKKS